jgi:hypothetical protein
MREIVLAAIAVIAFSMNIYAQGFSKKSNDLTFSDGILQGLLHKTC